MYELSSVKQNADRAAVLKNWHNNGGVVILGYDMFRNLTQGSHCRSKNQKKIFTETLVEPGISYQYIKHVIHCLLKMIIST